MPMVRNQIWVLPRCLTAPPCLFALVTFFMTFSYAGVSAFLALYARELDLMAAASNFLLCYAIFLMICRTFTGNICDKKGPKYVVYPCLLAFTIGLVALGYTNGSIMTDYFRWSHRYRLRFGHAGLPDANYQLG